MISLIERELPFFAGFEGRRNGGALKPQSLSRLPVCVLKQNSDRFHFYHFYFDIISYMQL